MEIEIVTTKKKLTKSIVNQMEIGTFSLLDIIDSATIIGKLLNVRKKAPVVYLIKTGTGYKLIKDSFYIDSFGRIRDGVMHGHESTFETDELRDKYWQKIKDLRRNCQQIYI